mmetsp:Transcript_11315/g.22222  ORF Transcript_11315/g.22222 Transcript_11315/m.22222 type:complete len:186 (+) Transcript_11315:797-1354(+)
MNLPLKLPWRVFEGRASLASFGSTFSSRDTTSYSESSKSLSECPHPRGNTVIGTGSRPLALIPALTSFAIWTWMDGWIDCVCKQAAYCEFDLEKVWLRERVEVVFGKDPSPRVKHLQHLSTSLHLSNKIFDNKFCSIIQDFGRSLRIFFDEFECVLASIGFGRVHGVRKQRPRGPAKSYKWRFAF